MKTRTGSLQKRSTGYYVRIMVEGKTIVRALKNTDNTPCKTLQEARRAQAEIIKVFALGTKKDSLEAVQRKLKDVQSEIEVIQSPKAKLADCWDRYLNSERPDSGIHTLKAYKQYTRQFVEWVGGHYPQAVYLSDVSKPMAIEYGKSLSKYNGCTFNKHLMFLRLLFRTLLDSTDTVFNKVKNKPIDSISHEPLTPEQIQAVLSSTTGELQSLLIIGAYTGLRLGDACLLKWAQLDLDKNLLTVKPSKTATRSKKVVRIPIHPVLKTRLETQFKKGEYVLPWVAWRYQNDISAMSHKIHKAFTNAGIETKNAEGKTVYSFHSLRFSLAQQLCSNGYGYSQVSLLLGHNSEVMSRYYSSLTDSVKVEAINSLHSMNMTV